jgi:hypothetical protein
MEHKQLTIVSVYGHGDGLATIPSISKSMKELPGSRGLILSIEKPKNLPEHIHWMQIYPLDYRGYSTFMMHCLYAFIDTEFCLVVQDDGWVLDGNNWKEDYYNYDYIGGITHAGLVGNELHLGFNWVDKKDPIVVQNGGFSLRSRRFLEAPNQHGVAQMFSMNMDLWNEDVQLSCLHHSLFTNLGYKIAPKEISKEFAIEHVAPIFHDDLDFSKLLGHHSKTRRLIKDNEIILPAGIENSYREQEFLDFLQSKGYVLNYVVEGTYEA